MLSILASAVAGILLGAIVAWLWVSSKSAALAQHVTLAQQQLDAALAESGRQAETNARLRDETVALKATLDFERRAAEEKIALVTRASEDLKNAFQALSADALKSNNESFLALATESLRRFQTQAQGDLDQRKQAVESLVGPIKESLTKVDQQIQAIENSRREAYGTLTQQVRSLVQTQEKLQSETGNLVKALRTPNVRGRWGEIQLRRVVEIAGMLPYCDFVEQASVSTSDGRIRPDLLVRLPGGKNIIVDAKTPLSAYLEACESQDDNTRIALLKKHADQIGTHMSQLSSKAYWDQFPAAPEFVIMFLPGEAFFSAALEQNPALIEQGVNQRVIPASPTTLIALLRAVAYGWQQETIAENAQHIADLGRDLYDRLCKLAEHMEGIGKNLDRAVDYYNKAVGTMESRVFAPARKFKELGTAIKGDLPEVPLVEKSTRVLQSADWKREESEGELTSIAAAGTD